MWCKYHSNYAAYIPWCKDHSNYAAYIPWCKDHSNYIPVYCMHAQPHTHSSGAVSLSVWVQSWPLMVYSEWASHWHSHTGSARLYWQTDSCPFPLLYSCRIPLRRLHMFDGKPYTERKLTRRQSNTARDVYCFFVSRWIRKLTRLN